MPRPHVEGVVEVTDESGLREVQLDLPEQLGPHEGPELARRDALAFRLLGCLLGG